MNKKQFIQGLDHRLQDKISHINITSFNREKIVYGVLKPDIIPEELKAAGITSSLLDIVSPNITGDNIIISGAENPDYQELTKYIVLEEYFKKHILRAVRNHKDINEILINTIETEIMDVILAGNYKKEAKDRIKDNLEKFHSHILQYENTLRQTSDPVRKNLLSRLDK